MRELLALYPCNFPVDIKCRALGSGVSPNQLDQVVSCNLRDGLVCLNREQPNGACFKYEVQITCCQCGYKQKIVPTRLRYATEPLKPIVKHEEERIRQTTKVVYPHQTKSYRQKITPPSDKFLHIAAPKFYHGNTFKPATYFVTYKPPGRKYTHRFIKTTRSPHFVPLTSGIHERFRTDATGLYKYKPPTKSYDGRITPTTVKHVFAPLPSKKYQGFLENQPTKKLKVFVPRYRPPQKITPTVSQREFFPVTGNVYHGHRSNPPTTIVQSHFAPRRYTNKISGTTTRRHYAPITVVLRSGTKKNPFRQHRLQIIPQTYAHRYDPTSTHAEFMPLEVKVYEDSRTNAPVTKYQCKYCYGEYKVDYSEDVYCTAPRGATLISCSDFYGSKENCSQMVLTKWKQSIKDCLVGKGVYKVGQHVDRATFLKVKADLLSCIMVVGDTVCRKSIDMVSFLLGKIFEICRVDCGVQRVPQMRSLNVDVTRKLKMCISQVNLNELEGCYPGLHETLMDAFVHDKPNAYLKIHTRNPSCLSQSFQHCDAQSLKSLEELVYENYGLCIEVTSPGQKKGCHVDTYSHYCSETDVRIFIGKTESCVRDGQDLFQQYAISKRLDVLEKCMSQYPVNCIFPNWEIFREILFYLVDQILDSPGGDKNCLEEFQPKYLQECSQTLVSVISSFTASKVALNRGTMKTIQNCFKDSLGSCDSGVRSKFLSILQSVTHSAYLVDDVSSPANMYRSIDSVRSGNQEVNICMKRFEDLSNENNTLSDKDLCDPLLSSNNMSRSHVLKKGCDGDDVTKWLSEVKKCVHAQSLSTSPHGMNLVSLLKVVKSCNEKSALECRPKERKEFKSIVNSLFYIINMFAVPSGSTSCLSSLKVDNIVRCHNHLHQYLVLDFKSSPEAHRRKSEDCLTGALKSCSRSFVLELLSVLEDCVGKHTAPLASSDGSYTACEPGTQNFPRNAQEYKKYCRPRSAENVPTEPYAADFYRKLPDSEDEKGLRSHGKRHTENYLNLSGNKAESRKNNSSFGNMFPNYLDEDYEYSEENDGSNYGSNLKSEDYDLNKKNVGLKSDENYAFYSSNIKDEYSKEEEIGIKPYEDEALDMRPSNRGDTIEKLDPSEVDTEESQSFTSSGKKEVLSLMFRSLSNYDELEEENNVKNLDNSKPKISTEYPRMTVPVLNLETSSKSRVENGEGSNEISGGRKGFVEKMTDSPKKYDDVEKCTIDDFDSYLDPLFDCQNIHMSLLFSSNQSTCSSITERSFETLALCLFEHRVPLTCEVSTKKQLEDFLAFLSLRLDTVMTYYRRHCSLKEPPCYESTKGFAHCSDDIYSHLIEPTSVRGPLKVFQCLASAVPKCSSEIPLMFLPSVYLPLGMNLSSVLQETKEKKCLAATTADIPTSSVCTEAEKEAAMQAIYSCLKRTNQKINESLQGADKTLHWSVLPMTVCVSVYPILECRQTDLDKFKQFVISFLAGIETWLKVFFQIFEDEADKKKGEDCLLQFTSPAMDKCLSLMFEYMTSFHSGHARSSDYPSQCVEDIFGGCGDIDTFHLLMKKIMNVTYEEDGSESEKKDPRVKTCMGVENEVNSKNCDAKQFDSLLLSEEKCQDDAKRGDVLTDVEEPIDFCKDCILKNINDMCVYEMPQLKEVVSAALKPTERCWKIHNIGKTCIQNVRMALEDKCLFDFHAYISNVKRGRYMKAAHFSRNAYNCINKMVTECSPEVHSSLFNFYSRICGVENLSNYRTDYVLGLNRAVNEIMM